MPTVDGLDIQISAQATKASASLDKLVGKLNTLSTSLSRINGSGLTGLANGVNRLASSMQSMKSAGTADFTRLAKNVQRLGQIDTASINRAASAMSQMSRGFSQLNNISVSGSAAQLSELAKGISQLGYKSATQAINNIPKLATSMRDLMKTLSGAPKVSQNLIDMTNALAKLARTGASSGRAATSLSKSLDSFSKSSSRARKNSFSLAAAFGKFYATWFLAIRGIKKLWGSVKSSMDYVETLNYFNAAFDQVAQKADLSAFQELGYDSAEEYANSFSKRAKELTAQMTGFAVTDKGTLEATRMPSLGIDPNQLMQYQAMFGQMASSIGITSENSLKLSRALTEIGADLASVKNMDFDKVWKDMASGLAGMSRTLDKYGVNIRNVNLQQKLNELGINANIQALNQNDKALLRTIILLDSTRYAWGDLADTINQPANQLRLINANFQNLGRTIGNLFLPLIQKVLPYINALVIALQRLFSWIGSLLGIDVSGITKSIGNTDFSGLIDDTDDLAGGLNNAAKAADKLKKGVRAFDELKVIETKDDSGSGADAGGGLSGGLLDSAFNDALSEYQKAWDKSFANMENRAQEMADKIEKMFEPIKKIIQDFAVGDFFQAGQDVSNLVVSITDFFSRAIEKVDWYGIGLKIGDFFAGIEWLKVLSSVGKLIWEGIKGAIELWKGSFDAAPIETAILSILALPALVGFGSKIIALIATPFTKLAGIITPVITTISGLFAEGSVFGAGGAIATATAPVLALAAAIAAWVAGLGYVYATNEEVRESLDSAIGSIREGLQPAIEFLTGTLLPNLNAGWDSVLGVLTPLGEFLAGTFTSAWQDVINPALTYIGETVLPKLTESFENLWNNVLVPLGSFIADVLEPVIKIISDALTMLWKNVIIPLATATTNNLGKAFEGMCGVLNETVIPIVNNVIGDFQFLWKKVFSPIIDFLSDKLKPVFEDVFESIGGIIEGIGDTFGGLIDFITGAFSRDWKKAWQGIKDTFSGIWKTLKNVIKSPLNAVIGIFEGLANGVVDAWNKIKSAISSIKISIPNWVPEIGGSSFGLSLPQTAHIRIPRLQSGGYIPSKYSIAMVGEHGIPELMGTVGGQAAVAGGVEITGIKDAIYSTSQQEIQLLREQNMLLQSLLKKEYGISKNDIGKAARDYALDYHRRTGNPAYSF